jgi:hypothetical protein
MENMNTITYYLETNEKASKNQLQVNMKNNHLHPRGTQTRKYSQVDFTEASRTVTYILRMPRQGEMIR